MSVITDHIATVCREAGITLSQIDAVAVSGGPGSYTGLRIGVSTAKGICHALNKPLIAVPTLLAMASGMKSFYPGEQLQYCPLLDARRMEVFTLVADADLHILAGERAYVIEEPVFGFVPGDKATVYFGSGLMKCKDLLPVGSIADEHYIPSAEHMHTLAFRQFSANNFADVAYYEPDYGKEFYTPAKKQG